MKLCPIQIKRNNIVIFKSKIKSFKFVKKDIVEATKGSECGISLVDEFDILEGDHIQSIKIIKKEPKLE